jgi:hypothetical protein
MKINLINLILVIWTEDFAIVIANLIECESLGSSEKITAIAVEDLGLGSKEKWTPPIFLELLWLRDDWIWILAMILSCFEVRDWFRLFDKPIAAFAELIWMRFWKSNG